MKNKERKNTTKRKENNQKIGNGNRCEGRTGKNMS